jgi:hypothetical protein
MHHIADLGWLCAKRRGDPLNVTRGQYAVDLRSSPDGQPEMRGQVPQIDAVFCSDAP